MSSCKRVLEKKTTHKSQVCFFPFNDQFNFLENSSFILGIFRAPLKILAWFQTPSVWKHLCELMVTTILVDQNHESMSRFNNDNNWHPSNWVSIQLRHSAQFTPHSLHGSTNLTWFSQTTMGHDEEKNYLITKLNLFSALIRALTWN